MRPVLIGLIVLTLAACGADGEPVYPSASAAVGISDAGVSVGTRVAATQGPFTVSVGVGI